MDLYAQLMELFALLTPEQQADLLKYAELMLAIQSLLSDSSESD